MIDVYQLEAELESAGEAVGRVLRHEHHERIRADRERARRAAAPFEHLAEPGLRARPRPVVVEWRGDELAVPAP